MNFYTHLIFMPIQYTLFSKAVLSIVVISFLKKKPRAKLIQFLMYTPWDHEERYHIY
jgi:hypothetical protein